MRTISKGTEPPSLTHWRRKNPNGHYEDLDPDIRRDIREIPYKNNSTFALIAARKLKVLTFAIMSI